jgi:hypothetical protein
MDLIVSIRRHIGTVSTWQDGWRKERELTRLRELERIACLAAGMAADGGD